VLSVTGNQVKPSRRQMISELAVSGDKNQPGVRCSQLEATQIPASNAFRSFALAYSRETCFLGDANGSSVLRRNLQDDYNRFCRAAEIFGHEIDGTPSVSPSSPCSEKSISQVNLIRSTFWWEGVYGVKKGPPPRRWDRRDMLDYEAKRPF